MIVTRRQWLLGAGGLAALGGGYGWSRYRFAMSAAQRRVSGQSSLLATKFGTLEYAQSGTGAPVLMIHGTGGGFDQGLAFGAALRRRGHRIIAPSRFGYLRSSYPADPSLANQAEALIALLDHLGIERLPIIGGSAGALSAAALALRYPDRCSALVLLVPAANVTGEDPVEMSPVQRMAVGVLLGSDLAYWWALHLASDQMIGTLLATDPRLMAGVSREERSRALGILNDMLPISARTRGMLNDARQAGHPARMDFSRLSMPVLVISAEDDRFGTAATSRRIAGTVKGAQSMILADGGHIWLGHDGIVADRVHRFLTTG